MESVLAMRGLRVQDDSMRYTNIQRWEDGCKIVEVIEIYEDGALMKTIRKVGVKIPLNNESETAE